MTEPAKELSAAPMTARQRRMLICGLLALLTLLVFLPVLTGHFQFLSWDDDINVTTNPHIRSLDGESIAWMFTDATYVRRYVPLMWLGFAINYKLGGLNPWGYHATNLLFHVLNAVLLFFVVRRLLLAVWGGGERADDARIDWFAAAGAAIWAVHPIRVETVAWVTGRIYPQCGLFFLLSLLAYLRATDRPAPMKTLAYWGSIVAFAASLLTHQLAITMVGVLLMLDIYPLKRLPMNLRAWGTSAARAVLLEKLPFLLVTAGVGVVTLWARAHASRGWYPPPTYAEFPLSDRILQAFYIFAHYLWKPWSAPSYYPAYSALVHIDASQLPFMGSVLLVLVMTVIAALLWRRWPAVMALWICHIVLLVPVIGWTEHPHYPSDRYSYLQGMVFSVIVAALLMLAWRHGTEAMRKVAIFGVAALVLAGSAMAYSQCFVWRSTESLFQHMIAELGNDPYRGDIYSRLGDLYERDGQVPQALHAYEESMKALPGYPAPIRGKAALLMKLADAARLANAPPDKIKEVYLQAASLVDGLAMRTHSPDDLALAGQAYGEAGDLAGARQRLQAVTQTVPENADYHLRYAKVLAMSGKRDEALGQLQAAIKLDPKLNERRAEIIASWANAAASQPATTSPR
jgi:tetratricopeptide (TPR) repeat protein